MDISDIVCVRNAEPITPRWETRGSKVFNVGRLCAGYLLAKKALLMAILWSYKQRKEDYTGHWGIELIIF